METGATSRPGTVTQGSGPAVEPVPEVRPAATATRPALQDGASPVVSETGPAGSDTPRQDPAESVRPPAAEPAAPVSLTARDAAPPPPALQPPEAPTSIVPPAASAVSVPVVAAPAVPVLSQAPAPAPAETTVDAVYRRKLAEFPGGILPVMPTSSPLVSEGGDRGRIVLIPPSQFRRQKAVDNGGARPLSSYDGAGAAASFEVATVAFGEGTSELGADAVRQLKEVAALVRTRGGASVRVIGRSSSPRLDVTPDANRATNHDLAAARAAVVARQLIRLGVSARHLYAGAADSASLSGDATEIYIDY